MKSRWLAALLFLLFAPLAWGEGRNLPLDCVHCHPTRDPLVFKRFPQADSKSPVSATETVCLTCHNSSLLDSRAKVGPRGFSHPTGIKSPRTQSGKLPLYGAGFIECATCHTPHPEGSTTLGRPGWLRTDPNEPFPCLLCHGDHDSGTLGHLGLAVAEPSLSAIKGRGGKVGLKGEVVCETCHAIHGAAGKTLLIAPYGDDGTTSLCRLCHPKKVFESAHPTGGAAFLPGGGKKPEPRLQCSACHPPHSRRVEVGTGCLDCHVKYSPRGPKHLGLKLEGKAAGMVKALGGKVGQGETVVCESCHGFHSGFGPGVLIAPHEREGEDTLCRVCHPKVPGKTGHVVGVPFNGHTGDLFPLGKEGRLLCSTCHTPHGLEKSDASLGLRVRDDGVKTCRPCHPEASRPEGSHLGTHLDDKTREGLLSKGGTSTPDGDVGCLTCHSAHRGVGPTHLIAPFEDGKARGLCVACHKITEVMDKTAKGVSEPCTKCHATHGSEAGSRKDPNVPCTGCHTAKVGKGDHPTVAGAGCAGCHSMHRGKRADAFIARNSEGEEACTTCHKRDEYDHGVGVKLENVSPDLLQKRNIRLFAGGKVSCTTCHGAHGSKERNLLNLNEEPLCLYCHHKENPFGEKGLKPGAHPIGVPLTEAMGAELIQTSGRDSVSRSGQILICSTCHRAHGDKAVPRLQCRSCHQGKEKVKNHDQQGGCISCHPIHSEKTPALSCSGCHEAKRDTVHGAGKVVKAGTMPGVTGGKVSENGGEMGCPTCHAPHGSGENYLRKESGGALCLACHQEKGEMKGSTHFEAAKRGGLMPCLECHPVHAPEESITTQAKRCGACHEKGMGTAPKHSPEGSIGLYNRASGLPLYDAYGRKNTFGFVDCPTCHDVHNPPGKRSFRLFGGNASSICLSCHPEKKSILSTPHVTGAAKGEDSIPCELCHDIHTEGKMPSAWTLGPGAQGTLNDRKCSACHGPPEGGSRRRGGEGSHPVNREVGEGMRPEGLKTYDATGKNLGGLVTCSTCHNIHGEFDEFGDIRKNFLRKNSSDGKLCLTCHPETASVEKTDHDTLRDGTGSLGPCSPCHVVHGGDPVGALWGLKPFPMGIPQNRRCKSCHSQETEKSGKPLRLYHHMPDSEPVYNERGAIYLQRPLLMVDPAFDKNGHSGPMPLFDRKGIPTEEGSITCVSCHNPHQWSPESPQIKPNPNAVWKLTTNFLKFGTVTRRDAGPCAECHQENLPAFFKRYHEVWSDLDPLKGDEKKGSRR